EKSRKKEQFMEACVEYFSRNLLQGSRDSAREIVPVLLGLIQPKTVIDGPLVLFSAAIPFQGGIGHINEQWPDYWVRYFAEREYRPIDCIRRHIWNNPKVEWWFAQNTFLFARQDQLESRPALKKEWENTDARQLALVHPKKHLQAAEWIDRLYQSAAD